MPFYFSIECFDKINTILIFFINMYKQQNLFSLFLIAMFFFCSSLMAQKVAIKTNLLYGATTTPNLQLEFGLGKKSTLDVGAGLNWFDYNDNKKFKHLLVQPEYRYWFCESFNGPSWECMDMVHNSMWVIWIYPLVASTHSKIVDTKVIYWEEASAGVING